MVVKHLVEVLETIRETGVGLFIFTQSVDTTTPASRAMFGMHLKVYGRLPCNGTMLLKGEEEVGSPHIADFVRGHRDNPPASA